MTAITITSSSLADRLKGTGLSSAKTQLVQKDLAAAIKESGGSANGTNAAFVRSALDKRIADDVASGQLTVKDAATVTKALDQIDAQSGASDAAAAANDKSTAQSAMTDAENAGVAHGGGKGGGGGGGGGSATKTELSRLVTVAGSVKTTIITYTDGTSDTETSTATASDKTRYDKSGKSTGSGDVVQDYLSTISPGTLIRQAA